MFEADGFKQRRSSTLPGGRNRRRIAIDTRKDTVL